MAHKIKIGFLISYDYRFLYDALEIVYDYADEIILAIDSQRRTWAGGTYELGADFFDTVKSIDIKNKIVFYEDNFYIDSLTPIENDTRERNLLSEKMGSGCWKLQIDSDEYFLNFDMVCKWLRRHDFLLSKPHYNAVNLRAQWITLFRKTQHGYLYIDNGEHFSFGVNNAGKHVFARDLDYVTNHEIYTNFKVVHQSWAREPQEILQKVKNWGHRDDFDTNRFFEFWKSVNGSNYKEFADLHPVYPENWPFLKFIECDDIPGFIRKYNELHPVAPVTEISPRFYKRYVRNKLKFYKR